MPSVLDARLRKNGLEKTITELIHEYEEEFGVLVEYVALHHAETVDDGKAFTIDVHVHVSLDQ